MGRLIMLVLGVGCLAMGAIRVHSSAELREEVQQRVDETLLREAMKPPGSPRVLYLSVDNEIMIEEARRASSGQLWFYLPAVLWFGAGGILLAGAAAMLLARRRRRPGRAAKHEA